MAHVQSGRSEMDRKVKIKYIPIAGNYKGYTLPVSVIADGKISKAKLRPHQWETVSVAIARELQNNVKKMKRSRMVPSGLGMEESMVSDRYDQEEAGVRSTLRDEGGEPDYDIIIDGTL